MHYAERKRDTFAIGIVDWCIFLFDVRDIAGLLFVYYLLLLNASYDVTYKISSVH